MVIIVTTQSKLQNSLSIISATLKLMPYQICRVVIIHAINLGVSVNENICIIGSNDRSNSKVRLKYIINIDNCQIYMTGRNKPLPRNEFKGKCSFNIHRKNF
jgi:hypothetical protein